MVKVKLSMILSNLLENDSNVNSFRLNCAFCEKDLYLIIHFVCIDFFQ